MLRVAALVACGAVQWDHFNNECAGSVSSVSIEGCSGCLLNDCKQACEADSSCKGFNFRSGRCDYFSNPGPRMEQLGCTFFQILEVRVERWWWPVDWMGEAELRSSQLAEGPVSLTDKNIEAIHLKTDTPCLSPPSGTKRMAVALRGGAFRQGWTKGSRRCGEHTYEVQKALAESIRKHIVRPFEALGWEVDLYLTAFPCFQTYCPNPKLCFNESGATAHYMRDLGKWLNASALDVFEPTLETVGTRFGEQGLHDSKQGRYAEGVLRMVQTSPNKYDYVICSRIDQGFRDDITAFLRWERQDMIAPFFGQPVRLHENVLAFPGCLLDTVVGVLHAGCVERSAAFDFGTCCFKEIRQVMKLRDTTHEGVNTFDFDGEQEQTYFVNNSVVIPMDLDDDIKRRYLSQGNGGDIGSSPRFWTQTMQGRAPGFDVPEQRDKLDAGLREVEFKPRDGDTASEVQPSGFVHLPRDMRAFLALDD